jgi:hypothetical protein
MEWLSTAILVLKDWQTLVAGLLTIATAFIAGAYVVRSTKRQIDAVREQFEETIRPFVVAKIGIYSGVIFSLEIENTGKSSATDLSLSIDRDFYQFGESGKNLKTFEAFKMPIRHFAPGEKLTFLLSQGFNMKNFIDGTNVTPEEFLVTAKYSFKQSSYIEEYSINTTAYYHALAAKSDYDLSPKSPVT